MTCALWLVTLGQCSRFMSGLWKIYFNPNFFFFFFFKPGSCVRCPGPPCPGLPFLGHCVLYSLSICTELLAIKGRCPRLSCPGLPVRDRAIVWLPDPFAFWATVEPCFWTYSWIFLFLIVQNVRCPDHSVVSPPEKICTEPPLRVWCPGHSRTSCPGHCAISFSE